MKTRDQAKQNGAFHVSLIDWLTNKSNRLTEWMIVCLRGHLICLLYQITEMKNATTTSPVKVMGARCKHDLNWNGWFCPIHVTSNQKIKLLESMMHNPLFHSFSIKLSISAQDDRGRGEGKSFSTIFTKARPWLKITGPGVWAFTLGEQVLQLSCAVMLCWTEVDTNLPHCSMWTMSMAVPVASTRPKLLL